MNASADANIIAIIFRIVGLKPKPLSPSIFFSKNKPNSTITCSLTFETSEKVLSMILLNDDLPLKIPSKTKLYVGNKVVSFVVNVIGMKNWASFLINSTNSLSTGSLFSLMRNV